MGEKNLQIAIAAGGTAGHINPALALAEELRDRGHRVRFFGQTAKLEGRLVPEAGFELVPVVVSGFDRERPWTLVSSLVRMRRAQAKIARLFSEEGAPDVAVGFGAYVEMALLNCCHRLGVPYVLHEQNSVAGLANKALAPHAAAVCISVPAARAVFEREGRRAPSVVLTGNPVRRSVTHASREAGRAALGVGADQTVLLVFGGSLGAAHINEGVCRLKRELLSREGLVVVHSTGADGFDETVSALALTPEEQLRWRVMPYISNMGEALAAADLVLSRAGASSIAEIAAVGVPSLLVPYPHATAGHQTTNARFLTDAGAAELLPDDRIDDPVFAETLLGLVDDPARREAMRAAALGLGQSRAAAALADEVEAAAGLR
ncbi:UDP-N-acetylglucosamine--N-acetylmuramyl-(pentapeptide) pyrophosphoryl-undecaprenol N-acetylglucosamine transferase [Olsenella uli]|uniref:UDP-N-acetylglucosamine--N-acetylmuramyl- (pentapeptide) pyrophosphoryl-undecaprenol N-acetylglucosamine transferase n=1 Tax=Olsenella uli TaxID=133926 RepID=UPI00195E6535|nr:UDP-N-acetylglucosamine--N-acetylmuramyl-(pentapeptide) pyrophosphoryl-undecaprenol N-acetylglucosamine transferase [Olsenella uli]MBM6676843.1 UDP-N-acetylglucosamine--N-acetylmuramyl-(pentapeptide) pyrophosphoryl-undecaprenol N-acetylglucosamine transferase [Olsenella uli]